MANAMEEEGILNELFRGGEFLAGGVGGAVGQTASHTIDTIKCRLQASQITGIEGQYQGWMNGFRQVASSEGLRGLYKGLTPPLLGQVAINTVVFSIEGASSRLLKKIGLPDGHPFLSGLLSGMSAGFVQCFICCPMELVKLRMQHTGIGERTPAVGLLREAYRPIWKTHGIRGLYQGMVPTIWRDTTGFGIYFGVYHLLKSYLLDIPDKPRTVAEFGICSFAGGLAGTASWLNYPLDTLKTRIQMDGIDRSRLYRGMWDCARKTWSDGGMWRGFIPGLLRAFVWSSACFPAYELTKRLFTD